MAKHVIVASFDTRNQAYEAASEIDRLDDQVVYVNCGAILEKDLLGHVTTLDTRHIGDAWGAVDGFAGGALLGALIGALAGPAGVAAGGMLGATLGLAADRAGSGFEHAYVDLVGDRLLPGKTALVMEVEEDATEPVDTVVARHRGLVSRRSITP